MDPPGAGSQTFDVAVRDASVSSVGITLETTGLRWAVGEGTFDSIIGVDLRWDGDPESAACTVRFANGAHLQVEPVSLASRGLAAYRAFVLALVDALGPEHRARIVFRRDNPPISAGVGAVFMLLLSALFIWIIASGEVFKQPFLWLALPMLGLFIAIFAAAFRRSLTYAPKQIELSTIAAGVLPPEGPP